MEEPVCVHPSGVYRQPRGNIVRGISDNSVNDSRLSSGGPARSARGSEDGSDDARVQRPVASRGNSTHYSRVPDVPPPGFFPHS